MKRPYLAILPVIIAAGIVIAYFNFRNSIRSSQPIPENNTPSQPKEVEYLAGFAVYTNGLKRTFADSKYLNLNEFLYIDSNNTNIIHVKKAGATWRDFFDTLPMEVDNDCLTTGTGQKFCDGDNGNLKYIINGNVVDDFFDREIKDTDHALIIFGSETEAEIKQIFRDNIQPDVLSPSM